MSRIRTLKPEILDHHVDQRLDHQVVPVDEGLDHHHVVPIDQGLDHHVDQGLDHVAQEDVA